MQTGFRLLCVAQNQLVYQSLLQFLTPVCGQARGVTDMALITENVVLKANAFEAALDRIVRFFEALRAGQAAAADLDRFAHMSDAALAAKGLNRETVSRAIMQRHFG